MDKIEMLESYEKHSKADYYKIGFALNGLIFAVDIYCLPSELLKLDKASQKNGGGQVLRLRLTKTQKKPLPWVLCV